MTISDEELRALLAAATPGPWEPYFTRHGDPYVRQAGVAFSFITSPTNDRIDAHTQVSTGPDDYGLANTELIAAAVNALPSLLDRLAALEARPEPDVDLPVCRVCGRPQHRHPWNLMQHPFIAAADGGTTPEPDDEASDEADDGPICAVCGVRRPEPGHTACGRCA